MKTIFQGKVPPPVTPWWIGLQVTCGYCATEVELEPADDVTSTMERCLDGKRMFSIQCPVCNVRIEFLEPT